jgi:hypothetical protein
MSLRYLVAIMLASTIVHSFLEYAVPAPVIKSEDLACLRGGGDMARKCSRSCNAANNYINLCPNGVGTCTVCSLGNANTNYVDADPNCGNAGFVTSPTRNINCGVQNAGNCAGIGVCALGVNSTNGCSQPYVVCPQGNCP